MNLSADEIVANLHYQVAALEGMANTQELALQYVKPHGALYNDMMAKSEVRQAVMQAVASYHRPLALMLQVAGWLLTMTVTCTSVLASRTRCTRSHVSRETIVGCLPGYCSPPQVTMPT